MANKRLGCPIVEKVRSQQGEGKGAPEAERPAVEEMQRHNAE